MISRAVHATCKSITHSIASASVAQTIRPPSFSAILTPLTGPVKGIPASITAIDAPMIEASPGDVCLSIASGEMVTTTSFTIPFGNIGLSALSTSLAYKTASSEGLHSLLLNLPPPIFPAAYQLSLYSTPNGIKSLSASASRCITAVTKSCVPHKLISTAPSQ